MNSFVRLSKPGEYTVRILYHDVGCIADVSEKDLKNLIFFSSEPFKLDVDKHPRRVIQLQRGSTEKAQKLIKELKAKRSVRIVIGKYDKSFHDFVKRNACPVLDADRNDSLLNLLDVDHTTV